MFQIYAGDIYHKYTYVYGDINVCRSIIVLNVYNGSLEKWPSHIILVVIAGSISF